MSLVILIGPGDGQLIKLQVMGVHILLASLYCVAFFGVGYWYFGVMRKPPVKWLLIMLSILGVLALPVAVYEGLGDSYLVGLLSYLAGWSVLLLMTTLVAFSYPEAKPSKQPGLAE
jgi:hypothetical protein